MAKEGAPHGAPDAIGRLEGELHPLLEALPEAPARAAAGKK
jgi:hypothetical protein